MNINTLRINKRPDRSIFLIETKKNGLVMAVSNRQLIHQWIKEQNGTAYLLKANDPVVLKSYSQLAKALMNNASIEIFFVVLAPFARNEYVIHKLPLLREL